MKNKTIKINNAETLKEVLDYLYYIDLGKDYVLYDDYELYNEKTDVDIQLNNAKEAYQYLISNKDTQKAVEDFELTLVFDDGGND